MPRYYVVGEIEEETAHQLLLPDLIVASPDIRTFHDHGDQRLWRDVRKSLEDQSEQHYTLGLAYPANVVDGHGEYMAPDKLEWTAWHWLVVHRVIGVEHADGTQGHAIPVESYIYRGPDWTIDGDDGEEQVIRAGDWLVGALWDDAGWTLVKSGLINGWSIQGGSDRTTHLAKEVEDVVEGAG